MSTAYTFVDRVEADSNWHIAIVPGGFKYTATEDGATMTLERLDPHPDIDVAAECGGTILKGTCVTISGSVALVEKP